MSSGGGKKGKGKGGSKRGGGDLSASLVDASEASSDSSSVAVLPADEAAAAAAGSAAGQGVFSIHPRAFGGHSSSSASFNAPQHSALASGEHGMEMIDLSSKPPARAGSGRRNPTLPSRSVDMDVHVQLAGDDEEAAAAASGMGNGAALMEDRSRVMRDGSPSGREDDDDDAGHDGSNPSASSASAGGGGGNGSGGRRIWPSVLRDGWKAYWLRSMKELVLSSKLNLLLIAFPAAVIAKAAGANDAWIFFFSLVALCPLAERISFVTDEMAKYTNETLGGLMSATMGNATEMIVSIFALKSGLIRIVQLSLLGSILSNLLLVQGCAFLVGGLKHKQQSYSQAAAKTNVSLLLLAVLALMMPTILIASNPSPLVEALQEDIASGAINVTTSSGATGNALANIGQLEREGITESHALTLSRFTAVLLLAVYVGLIVYQLKTHAHLFEGREDDSEGTDKAEDGEEEGDSGGDDDDDEPPVLGPWGAVAWALVITVIISVLSEFIVDAIDGAASDLGVPVLFIATILLPIVGNAAEHASAIIFAGRDKMDVALGISVGSSTQIALFVVPLMVVLGWMMGQPLSLDFRVFETLSLLLTVIFSSIVLSTGKGDWLYGVMMIMAYTIISAAFWLQHQPENLD